MERAHRKTGSILQLASMMLAICCMAFVSVVTAGAVQVKDAHIWAGPGTTRLVFDISGPAEYKVFTLPNPDRVVIDIKNARTLKAVRAAPLPDSAVARIRTGVKGANSRIVLDTKRRVKPKSALLPPFGSDGYRLVIDLDDTGSSVTTPAPILAEQQTIEPVAMPAAQVLALPAAPKTEIPEGRDILIAIDAGHGGEDPGAIGANGTREKDVVLAIARQLAAVINKEPGMRAILIREKDYFLSLRKRAAKARKHKADLFISIHADAHRNTNASGASVFALSERGATTEAARWLAERENAADLIGGVSISDKDDMLASVLFDLAQTATIDASLHVGARILDGLGKVSHLHKTQVEQAGFAVLKSPDIPSVLVETAFISNPSEERKLKDAQYQASLAQAVMSGIRSYFLHNPPVGSVLALRGRHVISSGDTLSEVASKYNVPVGSLRTANELMNDEVAPGQVLRIPLATDQES